MWVSQQNFCMGIGRQELWQSGVLNADGSFSTALDTRAL